jgi:hypothetical protein
MIQVTRYVAFNHPLVRVGSITGEPVPKVGYRVIGATVWPKSIRVLTEIRFPYGFQDHAEGFLYNPVVNGQNP